MSDDFESIVLHRLAIFLSLICALSGCFGMAPPPLLPMVKLLLDTSTGWPAHQMHSCVLLILITWKLENAVLHLEQEGLSCFGGRG